MAKKWWTLIAVCAGTFMLLLDITIVTVALPDIQRALHAGFGDLQWVIDAYALTLASLLLTAGVLADRYGRRLLFATGLVIFTAGSLLCGLAQTPLMLILSRSGQGIGGAIMFATSLALLAEDFRGRERGVAFGAWGAITGVAVAAGPILGGVITSGISWRGIFLVNVPLGIATVIITLLKVRESKAQHAHRPDWAGFALLTSGLMVLVYGLIRAGEHAWSDRTVIGCLAAGVVLLAAFLIVESRVAHPMFDLDLFRVPTFIGGSVAAVAMNGSLFSIYVYLVLYLQNLLGFSALSTGARLLLTSGATLVAATAAGRLSGRIPVRWLIGPGLLLVGVGLMLMWGIHAGTSWTHLIPGLLVAGFGAGMVNPPLASTAVGVVEPARAGMASGVNSTFRQVGLAMSIAIQGSLFASVLSRSLRSALAPVPALASHAGQVASAVRQGTVGVAFAHAPASARPALGHAVRVAFTSGIDDLLVFTAVIAFAGAVLSLLLIRPQDFVTGEEPGRAGGTGATEAQPAPVPAG